MRRNLIALSVLGLALALPITQSLAQRGGRGGGGGGQRGGGERGGGGGFGGGLSSEGSRGGESRGSEGRGGQERGGESRPGEGSRGGESRPGEGSRGSSGMGPYGHDGASSGSGARPGMGASSAARPGVPSSGSAATRPASGAASGYRPGAGAPDGAAAGAAAANNNRPSAAAGAATGAAVANNNKPSAAAGAAAGAAVANNNKPSAAAGAAAGAAIANSNHPYNGTYHVSSAALADQGAAVRAAGAYPAYSPAMYRAYPNAWPPANLNNNASVYAQTGYDVIAPTIGLAKQPMSYDYGGNVVAQSQAVYVNGDNAGTPQQYADQAGQLAATGNAQPAPDSTWQPLGVFAMVEGDQTTSDDTFQLAVNSQGMIRGNYHNLKDNSVVALAGSVDPKTQRAAWTIGGDKAPVYEAGIANLTQDQATMLLHLGDGQPPRQFVLVRLPDPASGN